MVIHCRWFWRSPQVSKFILPLMSNYNKMFVLNEQNCVFEHHRNIKSQRNLYNSITNVSKICSVYPFCAALFELMFVLNKDVLFHSGKPLQLVIFSFKNTSGWKPTHLTFVFSLRTSIFTLPRGTRLTAFADVKYKCLQMLDGLVSTHPKYCLLFL